MPFVFIFCTYLLLKCMLAKTGKPYANREPTSASTSCRHHLRLQPALHSSREPSISAAFPLGRGNLATRPRDTRPCSTFAVCAPALTTARPRASGLTRPHSSRTAQPAPSTAPSLRAPDGAHHQVAPREPPPDKPPGCVARPSHQTRRTATPHFSPSWDQRSRHAGAAPRPRPCHSATLHHHSLGNRLPACAHASRRSPRLPIRLPRAPAFLLRSGRCQPRNLPRDRPAGLAFSLPRSSGKPYRLPSLRACVIVTHGIQWLANAHTVFAIGLRASATHRSTLPTEQPAV
ncbi:hypothetical protein Taro_053635 [Colocasia esculenta]|uniref:Uncharacterized protein n=1 Tax=Colocasia esculenta TaxID=4460 RepID=A0A843XN65_COLES|nr:hypothetical protein [Colocasia esculenta]